MERASEQDSLLLEARAQVQDKSDKLRVMQVQYYCVLSFPVLVDILVTVSLSIVCICSDISSLAILIIYIDEDWRNLKHPHTHPLCLPHIFFLSTITPSLFYTPTQDRVSNQEEKISSYIIKIGEMEAKGASEKGTLSQQAEGESDIQTDRQPDR